MCFYFYYYSCAAAGNTEQKIDTVDDHVKRPTTLRITETSDSGDVITSDETQCMFNPNSYHMLYVASKEAFLYKQNSFTRAKEVSYTSITKNNYENEIKN